MFSIFSWEESKNMNYELDYNGRINLARTLLKEYFDGLLSFPNSKWCFVTVAGEYFHFMDGKNFPGNISKYFI